jgi:hypothetical protein
MLTLIFSLPSCENLQQKNNNNTFFLGEFSDYYYQKKVGVQQVQRDCP